MTDDDRVTDGDPGPHEPGALESRAAHRAAEARAAHVRRRTIAAAAAALALVVAVAGGAIWWSGRDAAPGPLSAPPASATKTCATRTPVTVWASSAMQGAATDLTREGRKWPP